MQTARGFLAALMGIIAIVAAVVMLDALGDDRLPAVGAIKALLGALIITVVLAAIYLGAVIDGMKPKAVQPNAQQPPQVTTEVK